MNDIYRAPASDLSERTAAFEGAGSLENGIAGNYDFSIGAILSEAWERTSGSKGTLWLAFLVYMIVIGVLLGMADVILGALGIKFQPGDPMSKMIVSQLASQVIQILVSGPLIAGFVMVGIKLVVRASTGPNELFQYFNKFLPLLATTLLMYLMIFIGFCLLIIPGIYLSVAYILAIPLVAEKNLSPWQALEASRKAITHRWFGVFGLYLVLLLIMIVAMIPLGIGLIWVFPMAMLIYGIVYRNIFGYGGKVIVAT